MKHVCSVRDIKTATFQNPFAVTHTAEAIRSFGDEINHNPEGLISKHHTDFELWHVADFNEESGLMITNKQPYMLISGTNAKGI